MTPKEYLKQIAKYDYMIYAAEEEAQKLRDALDVKAISYTGDKIQTSPSDIADLLARLADMELDNLKRCEEAAKLRATIINQILGMDDDIDIALLYQRYVKCLPLDSIAKKTNYSYDRIRHLHGVALLRFGEKYGPF